MVPNGSEISRKPTVWREKPVAAQEMGDESLEIETASGEIWSASLRKAPELAAIAFPTDAEAFPRESTSVFSDASTVPRDINVISGATVPISSAACLMIPISEGSTGGVAGSGGALRKARNFRCGVDFQRKSTAFLTPPPRRSFLAEFNDPDDLVLQRTFQKAENRIVLASWWLWRFVGL